MKNARLLFGVMITSLVGLTIQSCSDEEVTIHSIDAAEKVSIDRFSSTAGHLMVRDATNGLPESNAAVNFDQAPFITKGIGPQGMLVEYYNFDVQPVAPAPIYVLFKEDASTPVEGQLNIVDVIPGDAGYNDFWQVVKVTVPANYKANQVASYAEIVAANYPTEITTDLVNCPIVPDGSTATKRLNGGDASLFKGWYKEKIVTYFTFGEKPLMASSGNVPTSPIYVCFNINADQVGGGPASGFKVETGTMQTHNVVATVPSNNSYSPLWMVSAYDNADFNNVSDLNSALNAPIMNLGATVNCPIVFVQ